MQLRDWLKSTDTSIATFAAQLKIERAMVYRYFAGAVPRVLTMRQLMWNFGLATTG